MAKNKKGKVIQMLSPENYIRKKARTLPIHECWINYNWGKTKVANIVIARKHTNGNFTIGFFMVDLLCLGIKDSHFKFNISDINYTELLQLYAGQLKVKKTNYTLVHNIILAGLEFAKDYGFKPHKDFDSIMQYFLEEDTDNIELIEIECGENDQPVYVQGPYEDENAVTMIVAKLDKTAGKGNYKIIRQASNSLRSEYEDRDDKEDFEIENDFDVKSVTFQFKIQIKGITKPPVWRRITIPANSSFYDFHIAIQVAFVWHNSHLFMFSPKGFGSQPVIQQFFDDDSDMGFDDEPLNADEVKLSDIFYTEKQKFNYIYDFGDNWEHTIVLEKILTEPTIYPKLIAGKGQCPPEDCGGIWGYEQLKETLSDKNHPEFKEMAKWSGLEKDEIWDAAKFNLNISQAFLSEVFVNKND